jgi:predicted small lipoprotein YifL
MKRTAALLACLLLAACGQKGALYLPDENRSTVVPASPAASPATAPAADADATDEQRRQRQQQAPPANNPAGN